jgi:two-component system, NtrC family, sensor kinase
MMQTDSLNARILVIDDEESIRESFQAVLCPAPLVGREVDAAAAALFGEPETQGPRASAAIRFEVDLASHGKQGLALVEAAIAKGRPYAMICCDMRMPGWDGLETAAHIRRIDQRAEIVFVTAYSDHPLESIIEHVGANVGYQVKPFSTDELKQLATKCVLDWNRARELEALIRTVASIRGETSDIDKLLRFLLQQICVWLDTDSAALARFGRSIEFRAGIGALADPAVALPLLESARNQSGALLVDGVLTLPIFDFGVAVALARSTRVTPDRLYLLQLFLEHASVALKNSEMQAQLLEAQRMSAVGQAVGFILHDVRGPLGTARLLLDMLRQGDETVMPRDAMFTTAGRLLGEALDLVGDTLAFSRGQVCIEPRLVDLGEALAGTLEVARLDLGSRRIRLVAAISPGIAIAVDPPRICRVIQNLVHNAADAVAGRPDALVQIEAVVVAGGVDLQVIDNGSGLSAEAQRRLFQPFATAGKAGGTGFGLAIVQQIVLSHRGRISIQTGPAGTRFTVHLPDSPALSISSAA